MSGLSLRALLESSNLSLELKLTGKTAADNAGSNEPAQKASFSPTAKDCYDASQAYLNRVNIWDAPEMAAGGFNLEYMDLEEFLQETGLESLERAVSFPAPPSVSSQSSSDSAGTTNMAVVDGAKMFATPPPPVSSAAVKLGMPVPSPAVPQLLSDLPCSSPQQTSVASYPSSPVSDSQSTLASSCDAKDNGVVDLPGKEGFDPENHKFAPDELVPQPIIKKSRKVYVPEDLKDDRYWARRKKNNYAAKRSRDARRAKENQIIMRAAFLEQHNDELSVENENLREENKTLAALVHTYKSRLGEI